MSLSQEHLAKMREGRERWEAEEAQRRAARRVSYSDWVREDARLWRAYLAAREAHGPQDPERLAAYRAWHANVGRMPGLPS